MALNIRGVPDALTFALVVANNQRMADNISTNFHQDRTSVTGGDYRAPTATRVTISSAAATDLATSITMLTELKADLNTHFADTIAHDTAVSAAIATAAATDLTTAMALANAIKAAYNTHLSASNVHFTNDSTNTIAAATAIDQTTLNTMLTELKTDVNAHLLSAPVGTWLNVVSP